MDIHQILRAQDVKRWGIVRMHKQQSLAEHSFNVAMIARALAKALGVPDEQITKAALCHDLDEIITGDIPTPFKAMAREKGMELNEIYQHATGRTLAKVYENIVKLADILEARWYVQEYGYGTHALVVTQGLETDMWAFINKHFVGTGHHLTGVINTILLGGDHE